MYIGQCRSHEKGEANIEQKKINEISGWSHLKIETVIQISQAWNISPLTSANQIMEISSFAYTGFAGN